MYAQLDHLVLFPLRFFRPSFKHSSWGSVGPHASIASPPPSAMPDTATHNIDTIIEGHLYIGKYAFSSRVLLPFRIVSYLYLTVFPLRSPSTSADILA